MVGAGDLCSCWSFSEGEADAYHRSLWSQPWCVLMDCCVVREEEGVQGVPHVALLCHGLQRPELGVALIR